MLRLLSEPLPGICLFVVSALLLSSSTQAETIWDCESKRFTNGAPAPLRCQELASKASTTVSGSRIISPSDEARKDSASQPNNQISLPKHPPLNGTILLTDNSKKFSATSERFEEAKKTRAKSNMSGILDCIMGIVKGDDAALSSCSDITKNKNSESDLELKELESSE